MKLLHPTWTVCTWCGRGLWTFILWTLWLGLALLLLLQIGVAVSNELEVPAFILRSLEERFEASGIHATFGRASFDPSGRVLIEDTRLALPSHLEPIVTAHAVYVRLDPWALLEGKFEPRELRVMGASWLVPPMFAPSGQAEEIVRDFDATIRPGERELTIDQLTAYIAGVSVTAHGTVHLTGLKSRQKAPLPLVELLANHYPAFCRTLVTVTEKLAILDQPSLHLEFISSESRGAIAKIRLLAHGLKLDTPMPLEVTGLQLATKFPLFGDTPVMAHLELEADELHLLHKVSAHGIHAQMRGLLKPGLFTFEPRELKLTADDAAAEGFATQALLAQFTPGPLPQFQAEAAAQVMGAPLAVQADADLHERTATLRFNGTVSPALLTPISARVRHDVRKFFDFQSLVCDLGTARFGPGWKFQHLEARVAVQGVDAYHVPIDEAHGKVEFDGRHFNAPEAFARIGENFARGSYAEDIATRDYRFLLEGRLRPLDIGGWFHGNWWPNFFKNFEFPVAPPDASVDVNGRWTEGRRSVVFVYANAAAPIIRGAKFDRVRTLLFIRPTFYDGLAVFAAHESGTARGTFTYAVEPETFAWRSFDLNVVSSIGLPVPVQMIGPMAETWLTPFEFEHPPALNIEGRIEKMDDGKLRQNMRIGARSQGTLRFYHFPLENVSFNLLLKDDNIMLNDVEVGFAGGRTTGQTKIWGRGVERRLNFDYTLKEASLGRAVAALEEYSARKKGVPLPPPGKFVQEKTNVRVDITAKAEGLYSDPYSYHGNGNATLKGAELGQVHMLGLLSQLLKFTALRFTDANADFRIDGPKLVFPQFSVTGANSAIHASGDYALDRRELNFSAKIFPWRESKFILQNVVGAVLSPLSNMLEVKLTGSLEKPAWAFAIGPTNFLRSLTGRDESAKSTPPSPLKRTEP
jgi:AsmA-like C-terminal region